MRSNKVNPGQIAGQTLNPSARSECMKPFCGPTEYIYLTMILPTFTTLIVFILAGDVVATAISREATTTNTTT